MGKLDLLISPKLRNLELVDLHDTHKSIFVVILGGSQSCETLLFRFVTRVRPPETTPLPLDRFS